MLKKQITIPLLKQAQDAYTAMTPSERWLFYVLAFIIIVSSFALMMRVYIDTTVPTPASGGSFTEGVVGAPRFINPVLAPLSQTDKDLSELIYAGLMTTDENGNLVPELAESYTVSNDSKVYTFTLRKGLTFHDGTPLTASDVVFTIEKVLQPDIKSPERPNWEGVIIEQVNDLAVKFTLSKPYAQFLQNTTLGILPEEHWYKLTADEFIFSNLNTSPIGAGPYRFDSMEHDNSGIPSSIRLSRNKDYVLGTPYIKAITLNFYPSRERLEEALLSGDVSSISEISAERVGNLILNKNLKLTESTLPRIFAIFFNQSNNEALVEKRVRKALRDVINTKDLINSTLGGYARPIYSPMIQSDPALPGPITLTAAKKLIEDAGWVLQDGTGLYVNKNDEPLTITITTANSKELKDVADYIASKWRDMGISVKIEVFEPGDIANTVLRSRDYEALLFGEILDVDPDLYAFWHSSQRNDPGLNLANYTNTSVDDMLLEARQTLDDSSRKEIYNDISEEINNDVAAIFLYAPSFLYIYDTKILGITFPDIMEPHNRFAGIHKWHINTNRSLRVNNK